MCVCVCGGETRKAMADGFLFEQHCSSTEEKTNVYIYDCSDAKIKRTSLLNNGKELYVQMQFTKCSTALKSIGKVVRAQEIKAAIASSLDVSCIDIVRVCLMKKTKKD
jgi:hypothetical protein